MVIDEELPTPSGTEDKVLLPPIHKPDRFWKILVVVAVTLLVASIVLVEALWIKSRHPTPMRSAPDVEALITDHSWQVLDPGDDPENRRNPQSDFLDPAFKPNAIWTFWQDGDLNAGKLDNTGKKYDILLGGVDSYRWELTDRTLAITHKYRDDQTPQKFTLLAAADSTVSLRPTTDDGPVLHFKLRDRVSPWATHRDDRPVGFLLMITIWGIPVGGLAVTRLWGVRTRQQAFVTGFIAGFGVSLVVGLLFGVIDTMRALTGASMLNPPASSILPSVMAGAIYGIFCGLLVGMLRAWKMWQTPRDKAKLAT